MDTQRIHLIGACGIAMGTLALMLREAGHTVTGSDTNAYPPMSVLLENSGIKLYQGYAAEQCSGADLIVIGNAISRGNPEAEYVLNERLPYLSMAGALYQFFLQGKEVIAVSGTHGKTTTTALLAHILETAGLSPSFFVGGITKNYGSSFRLGKGDYFVIEGDEYDSAFFEKVPKFMQYRPHHCVLTSLEYDHADIYGSLAEIELWFKRLVNIIPENGNILYNREYERLSGVVRNARAYLFSTGGDKSGADFHFTAPAEGSGEVTLYGDGFHITTVSPIFGEFNLQNITAASAMAHLLGVSAEDIAKGIAGFAGVKRRQECIYTQGDVLVYEDFAHHPTAIQGVLAAFRRRYPEHRLWAVYEPRSATGRRNVFQEELPGSFRDADRVVLMRPWNLAGVPEGKRLDIERVRDVITREGGDASLCDSVDDIIELITNLIDPEGRECILILSNGGFGGIYEKLPAQLREMHLKAV